MKQKVLREEGLAHPDVDPLLRPSVVADLLALEEDTLANWRARTGQSPIPFLKLNRRDVRYRKSVVVAFIDALEAGTSTVIREEAERRNARESSGNSPFALSPAGGGTTGPAPHASQGDNEGKGPTGDRPPDQAIAPAGHTGQRLLRKPCSPAGNATRPLKKMRGRI